MFYNIITYVFFLSKIFWTAHSTIKFIDTQSQMRFFMMTFFWNLWIFGMTRTLYVSFLFICMIIISNINAIKLFIGVKNQMLKDENPEPFFVVKLFSAIYNFCIIKICVDFIRKCGDTPINHFINKLFTNIFNMSRQIMAQQHHKPIKSDDETLEDFMLQDEDKIAKEFQGTLIELQKAMNAQGKKQKSKKIS